MCRVQCTPASLRRRRVSGAQCTVRRMKSHTRRALTMNCAHSTGKVTHLEVRRRLRRHIAGDVDLTRVPRYENGRCTHPTLEMGGTKHALMNLRTSQRRNVPEGGETSSATSHLTVMYLYARERGVWRTLFSGGGVGTQCRSALRQGPHVPPPRVHHRSPGVKTMFFLLGIHMGYWCAKRRAMRNPLECLPSWGAVMAHMETGKNAHGVSSLRSCLFSRIALRGSVRCEATHNAEAVNRTPSHIACTDADTLSAHHT